MMKMPVLFRLMPVVAACWFASPGRADENADLIAQLDELDRSIAESRTLTTRTAETLESLRRDLYEAAVQTRDGKRLSEAIASGEGDAESLEALKADIINAGVLLRDLNSRIKTLADISESASVRIESLQETVDDLKASVVNPGKADAKRIRTLEEKLADAEDLAVQRGRVIERLNRQLRDVQAASPDAGITERPRIVNPKISRAEKLLEEGQVDDAARLFNEAVYESPDSDDARIGLAACYFERGDLELARRMIEEVLSRDSANPRAHGLMGAVQYSEGNLKRARRSLEKAVKTDPSDVRNLNYLGVVLFASGRQSDGIEKLQSAVIGDPAYTAARYNLAVMLATAETPDLTASRIHYEKALELGSPRDPLMDQLLGLAAPASPDAP